MRCDKCGEVLVAQIETYPKLAHITTLLPWCPADTEASDG